MKRVFLFSLISEIMGKKRVFTAMLFLTPPAFLQVCGQQATLSRQPSVFFPRPMNTTRWQLSLGIIFTTIPPQIAEEVPVTAPAGDVHLLRKISPSLYADARINIQVVQNHFSAGLRWACSPGNRFSFSVGDDMAWWFGILNREGFRTNANGWINYPNLSIGLRVKKSLLLTLKSELLFSFYYHSKVGDQASSDRLKLYNGWAESLVLEQPFYKKTNFIIGFRVMHSNFFWETWSLYETFKPKLIYPELTLGFLL